MKIAFWLNNPMSAVNGIAVIEVEPGEIADIEKMLVLVDGDSVGHFGVSANLVSINNHPEIIKTKYGKDVREQFGYPNASTMQKSKRYYKVFVHRD